MNSKKIRFITLTAMFIAMLVACQAVFSNFIPEPTVKQLITGSSVNLILVSACLLVDWKSGAIVAVISPFMAFFLKVVPAPIVLVPFIALSNLLFVATYAIIMKFKFDIKLRWVLSVVLAAGIKYGVIYLITNKVLLWFWTPAPKIVKQISVLFGTNQLITALIGGAVAMIIIPLITRALKKSANVQ